jgi:hypothetical protein
VQQLHVVLDIIKMVTHAQHVLLVNIALVVLLQVAQAVVLVLTVELAQPLVQHVQIRQVRQQ